MRRSVFESGPICKLTHLSIKIKYTSETEAGRDSGVRNYAIIRHMNMGEHATAFTAAYDAHADELFRFALYSVGDRELAKDLVAESFTKVWGAISRGTVIENIRAFCYHTLRNVIIDYRRKKRTLSLETLAEGGFDPPGNDGRSDIEHSEELRNVQASILGLPESLREIVQLRYIEGYAPKEISELLGVSQSLVSVRIFRAVAMLKKKLKHE